MTTRPPSDPTCLVHDDRPAVWTSPTGHHFCQDCRDSWDNLALDQIYPADQTYPYDPVDLHELMTGERPEEDWMVEPILPAGKLCGIISKRGEGKSILMLDIAAAKATGQPTLAQAGGDPVHVIYIDMEMGPDDLYQRLESLGYLPDHPNFKTLCEHLHYYQLVTLPPLDTEAGGEALEDLVERHRATLVVIDTVSRVVGGDENDSGPYRELFRHTETRLKRRRVTLARLDHLGKDKERGSRGSSAKEDPLDVVWQLAETAIPETLSLMLTKGRQPWIPRSVTIHRQERGEYTVHVLHNDQPAEWLLDLVALVDSLGLADKATVVETQEALKKAGKGKSKKLVAQIARFRRGRLGDPKKPEPSPEPQFQNRDQNRQNREPETLINIEENGQNRTQNRSEPFYRTVSPPKGGTVLEPTLEPDLDDIREPEIEDLQALEEEVF